MSVKLEAVAVSFEEMAAEFEKAREHALTAAKHFRSKDVPRGCAHAMAAQGHLLLVRERLEEFAKEHSAHATP